MAITDESHRDLFELLESKYGREGALLIMGLMSPPGGTELATKRDLDVQRDALAGDLAALRQELDRATVTLSSRFERTRSELVAETAALGGRFIHALAVVRDEDRVERRALSHTVSGALLVALVALVIAMSTLG